METRDQWLPVARLWGEINQKNRGFLGGNEDILHGIIMMSTCHYTFVQTH